MCTRKEILSHDNDIDLDLGIFISSWNDVFLKDFASNGFRTLHQFGNFDIGLEYSLMKDNIKIDLFFYYESRDYFWQSAWKQCKYGNPLRQMLKHKFTKFKLQHTNFLGVDCFIPDSSQLWLEEVYGKDWQIPNKNWRWDLDPKNMKEEEVYIPFKNLE